MTHLQQYDDAGKALMGWIKENPPENVSPFEIHNYKTDYGKFYLIVERELFMAYNEKEIDSTEYAKKCTALEEIHEEVMTILNKKDAAPMIPPSIEAIMRMLHDRRDKGDKGEGGGFIIFGGKFP